ncbi:MAG: aldo/keto reductase [Tagaea sp.]
MPVALGLGLLSIGRRWGVANGPPPARAEAVELVAGALALGVTFFDTAPAYADSEEILGEVFAARGGPPAGVVLATKMGEHWDPHGQSTTVDHGYDALRRSIDRSLERLGRIDLLQVHKATPENVGSDPVLKAVEYARTCGVREFGASVGSMAAVSAACRTGRYRYVQFPFSSVRREMEPAFELLRKFGVVPIVNRPLDMGSIVRDCADAAEKERVMRRAFEFIRDRASDGVVLTGTRTLVHLTQSVGAFGPVS